MSTTAADLHRHEHPASALVEICSVRLGERFFGVSISHIVEIVGSARPKPVPLAPSFVGGLVHYRGDVLTTVSLRQLLGLPPLDGLQDILILESAGGCFGLLVDAVGEVLTIPAADHEPNPSTLNERTGGLFAGAYKLKAGLLVMIDPEQLDPTRLDLNRAQSFLALGRPALPSPSSLPAIVAIGVSTGGPAALDILLPALPTDFPLPVLIVQHMPELFTSLLADRLNRTCRLTVREAAEGDLVRPGAISIARRRSRSAVPMIAST